MHIPPPVFLAQVAAVRLALGALWTLAYTRPAGSRTSLNYELSYPLIYPSQP